MPIRILIQLSPIDIEAELNVMKACPLSAKKHKIRTALPSMAILKLCFEIVSLWTSRCQDKGLKALRSPFKMTRIRCECNVDQTVVQRDLIFPGDKITV